MNILLCLANVGRNDCVTVWRRNAGPIVRTTFKMPEKVLTSSTCFVVNGPPYLCFPTSILEDSSSVQ